MQHIQEYNILNNEILEEMFEYVDKSSIEFEDSMVYAQIDKEKLYAPETRNSKFRLIKDKHIFDICNKYIDVINSKNKYIHYILQKNDVTNIRYGKGDFFKQHEDFLSIASNVVQEYTMIICTNKTNCVGGETKFIFNDHFSYNSKASTIPGHSVIFRKDLTHEGIVLEDGCKDILTLNLYGVDKKEESVIVKFKHDTRICTIPYNKINIPGNNLLKSLISFSTNECINGMEVGKVIIHKCDYTFDEFKVIDAIYNGYRISYNDYNKNTQIIDYYGFKFCDILLTNMDPVDELQDDESFNSNILLYTEYNKYVAKLDEIKKQSLPYMPFKYVFAEGYTCNDERGLKKIIKGNNFDKTDDTSLYKDLLIETDKIPLAPFSLSFSENNNIYKFCTLDIDSGICNDDEYDDDTPEQFFSRGYDGSIFYGGLKYKTNDIVILLLSQMSRDGDTCDRLRDKIIMCDIQDDQIKRNKKLEFYSITKKNKLVIQEHHHNNIFNLLEKFDLTSYVKERLKTLKIKTPQSISSSSYMCNEQVYDTLNFVKIYGFINMEHFVNK